MAEEAEAPVKKKGGNKIAIVGVSVVMLLTGGFFGLKMHGGSAAAPAEKLGDIIPIHEFLVNMKDDSSKYLRTEISVQADGTFHKDEMDKNNDVIMDAIVGVLREETMDDVRSTTGTRDLKKKIAAAANKAYWLSNPDKPAPDPKTAKSEPDWDSNTGPILKVFFTSFAFQ